MNDSRITFHLRAFVLTLAFVVLSLGLLAGYEGAQLIEGRAADLAQGFFAEGR